MSRILTSLLFACLLILAPAAVRAADEPTYNRTEDVIYGRKFGTALTMDVFTPKKDANGCGVIFCVSGGWFSSKEAINPAFVADFLKRGYTVFAVVHGCQPKFTVPEILQDMNRAVRYIRYHAKDYKIDPDKLGITGGSAGGHLSLMQGTAGNAGDAKAKDPIDRVSSRVRAVACFFPPSDFLNWGVKDYILDVTTLRPQFRAALDYREFDNEKRLFLPVTDSAKAREIAKKISPIYHVTAESAPTLIIHGNKDDLVPIQQAEIFIDKLKEAGVPAELIVKKDAGHGWPTLLLDLPTFSDWFDKHLRKIEKAKAN